MLQHLCIARAKIVGIECTQERRMYPYTLSRTKDANLVFQSVKINARLTTDSGIDHSQQRGRDIDEIYPTLERGRSEAAQVSDHPAAQTYY